MLAPETRVLLTDALRPPDGFRVDVAVGTTYSLDLTALLLAPLSFAMLEPGDDLDHLDPATLLGAVRQYCDRTTVFCQAGAIAVPSAYRSILTFAEDSVHEVTAPAPDRLFHPKIWALRFAASDGSIAHRLVCLSRNLTFDRSWDSALVLDEDDEQGTPIDPAPLCAFLQRLPGRAVRTVPAERAEQVESLAMTFANARLSVPAPYDNARLLPLGLGDGTWPLPRRVDRILAVSPFLDVTALRRSGVADDRTLVSRPETFDRLGSRALEGWRTYALDRAAEGAGDELVTGDDPPSTSDWSHELDGLHAKILVWDEEARGHLLTGSANLTSAAWNGNVEFSVELSGPVQHCGVAASLSDDDGFARLLQEYTPPQPDGTEPAAEETARALDAFHQALASGSPHVEISSADAESARLVLTLDVPTDAPGTTRVWPITLHPDAFAQGLAPEIIWPGLSLGSITPFIAVETTAGSGPARATRRCVLRAELIGDLPGRRETAVLGLLADRAGVLRYLAFLLGNPTLAWLKPAANPDPTPGVNETPHGNDASVDVVLFEPLVRAAVRDRDALARVANLVDELRSGPDTAQLLPEGFDDLWQLALEVASDEVER